MPRLFCALKLPAGLSTQLHLLRGGLNGARWIEPENHHITLHFFGDVDRHTANDLSLALSQIDRPTMALQIERLDAFGGDAPRALIARIKSDPLLTELQAEIGRIARRLKTRSDKRKFIPHITLARLHGTSAMEVAGFIASRGGFQSAPFEVEGFELLSSRDSIGGGPYICEERYDLRDYSLMDRHEEANPAMATSA